MPANGKSSPQPHDKPNGVPDGKPVHQLNEKPNELLHVKPSPLSEELSKEHPNDTSVGQSRLKPKAKGLLAALDHFMLRLNKLFAPAQDLSSVLTTFNYTLYLLAYLDNKVASFVRRAVSLVRTTSKTSYPVSADSSSFARLGNLINEARTTLRLFGLIPLYVRARNLWHGPSLGEDKILYIVDVLQCGFDSMYHVLENIAFLTQHGIMPRRLMARWMGESGKKLAVMYALAHRAWFVAVSLHLVRYFRYAQIEWRKLSDEDEDQKGSWTDMIAPVAWLPLSWQVAGWTESAFSGSHLGIHGFFGVLMDLGRTEKLWQATQVA